MLTVRQLGDWFLKPITEPRTTWEVVQWWEARRLPYNLFLLVTGFCSFAAFCFFVEQSHVLRFGEDAIEPLALILGFFAANLCYTGGWVVETIALPTAWGRQHLHGPRLMRLGLKFSLFVILLPTVLWAIIWVVHLVS